MRSILILLLLCLTTLVIANPFYTEDIADSLFQQLKEASSPSFSYYLIPSGKTDLSEYLQSKLVESGRDIRLEQDLADKSIQIVTDKSSSIEKRKSFIFNRYWQTDKYSYKISIFDNKSSKIEHEIKQSFNRSEPMNDDEISLWQPLLISLITGTLIYSLWAIE